MVWTPRRRLFLCTRSAACAPRPAHNNGPGTSEDAWGGHGVAETCWILVQVVFRRRFVRAELDALGISPGGLMRTPEGDEATQTEVYITQPFLPGISVGGVAVCRWVM